MLDAPALRRRRGPDDASIGVEDVAVRTVADRVGRHLHAAIARFDHRSFERGRLRHEQATLAWLVMVVGQHRRATAAQRAVGIQA